MNFEKSEHIYSQIVALLPKAQIDFFHFAVYKAYGLSDQDMKTYAAKNDLEPNAIRMWKRNLVSKGLLKSNFYDSWNGVTLVNPECFLPCAFHLAIHESKRLEQFEGYKTTLRNQHHFLWNIVYKTVDGGNPNAASSEVVGTWPIGEEAKYLTHVCFEEEFKGHVLRLEKNDFNQLINHILEHNINTLTGEARDFDNLESLVREYYSGGLFGLTSSAFTLLDKIGLFRYFYDGTQPKSEEPTYLYTTYEAIRELYKGNTLTSLEKFEKALKARNNSAADRNISSCLCSIYSLL